MSQPISIRLDPELDARLEALAKKTGRTKTYYVREAIAEQIEDLEDLYLARQVAGRLDADRERRIPLTEIEKQLGLDD